MSNTDSVKSAPSSVAETYAPDQERTLDTAILEAIATYEGTDCTDLEFVLRDDIDPDTLGDIFHHEMTGDAFVQFTTGNVRVDLWTVDGSDTVEIRVTGRSNGWR